MYGSIPDPRARFPLFAPAPGSQLRCSTEDTALAKDFTTSTGIASRTPRLSSPGNPAVGENLTKGLLDGES